MTYLQSVREEQADMNLISIFHLISINLRPPRNIKQQDAGLQVSVRSRWASGFKLCNYSGRKVVARHVFLHDTNTCEYTVPCSGSIWAVPKGVAQSIAISYCIQHGGGSNCPATETWVVANLFLQSRGFPSLTHPLETLFGAGIKKETCWWLYHQGSVSLGVGNFRLHLSQRIRVWFSGWMSNLEEWNPDILGSNICMFHPTSDDNGKFVAARICCKNETFVSIFKYCWRIRTSRWGTLMPWSFFLVPSTSVGKGASGHQHFPYQLWPPKNKMLALTSAHACQLVCMQSNSRWFRVIDCHWSFTNLRDHTLQ